MSRIQATFIRARILGISCAILAFSVSQVNAVVSLTSGNISPVLWGSSAVSTDWLEYSVGVTSSGLPADESFLNVVGNDGSWLVQNLPVGFELGAAQMATLVPNSL